MSSSSSSAAASNKTDSNNNKTLFTGTVMGTLRGWREYMAPTRQTTAFLEKGVLTPDEFVRAGDELVFRCPAWSWAASSTAATQVSHLPADKQYLITKHVPCPTRVSELEAQLGLLQQEEANGGDDDDGDWLISTIVKQQQQPKQSSLEDEFDILDQEGEIVEKQVVEQETDRKKDDDEEEEYADMANFEDEDVLIDDDNAAAAAAAEAAKNNEDDNLLAVRTYDLSITYDKYYQTPRVWMVGHSSTGQPLTGAEMLQDVMPDYANKTVTIEAHPHVSGPHASIHPCKHGKVMKTIVRNLMAAHTEDGEEEKKAPSVEMYLFIFLKFVSSIIPTINYDFTMDVECK